MDRANFEKVEVDDGVLVEVGCRMALAQQNYERCVCVALGQINNSGKASGIER